MFIGVYLCSSLLVLGMSVLALTAVTKPETQWRHIKRYIAKFLLITGGLILLGLIAFVGLSAVSGILPFGQTSSVSLPQDYIAYGLFGWLIMAIGLLGILSPALTAVWLRRQLPQPQ